MNTYIISVDWGNLTKNVGLYFHIKAAQAISI